MSKEIILRNREFMLGTGRGNVLLLMMFLGLVLPPLAIWFIFESMADGHGTMALATAFKKLLSQVNDEAFAKDPLNAIARLLIYLSLPLYLLYFYLASRFERLTLTAAGIRYTSPLPDAFRFLLPGWYLPWDQITQAVVKFPGFGVDPKLATLSLQTRAGNRRLRPAFWVNPDTWTPPKTKLSRMLRRNSTEQALQMIMGTDLVSHVQARVRDFRTEPSEQPFRLEDNPWSHGMAVLMVVLLGYALVDAFIIKTEVLAETPPYSLYAAGGLLVTLGCAFLLQRTGVPWPTGIGLAVMTGLAFSAAMHPAFIRLNALTDRTGPAAYTYARQPDGAWQPETAGLPSLSIDQAPAYWAQFKTGSTHRFTLRKGGLGFWQLDEAPLRDAYHDYFDRMRQKRRKNRAAGTP